ncbi:hypothetical protein KY290_035216 [Solanum tuberosum]|uniref:Uncharacterized protein n=1 Tax=Solanum tuberosum TaxID=4113 RepID=A0ABQ7U781_SOLTU|nr:hypothetical protein KY289_033042 [Solanum tuberosum]KAH0647686.1 hypothetical protein KY285_032934 [Solanum tuberosum]KAH0742173.1 hypothetical protein KY290_035216 [Solanum tuberosum]
MENRNNRTNDRRWPKKTILVRHGESEGNEDKNVYTVVPNHKVQLKEKGKQQAKNTGELFQSVVGNSKVYFYVSPFLRTFLTLKEISSSFCSNEIIGVRE